MNIIKPHKYVGFFTYSEDKPTSSGSVGLVIALFRVLRPATLTHYVRNSIIAQNSAKCAIKAWRRRILIITYWSTRQKMVGDRGIEHSLTCLWGRSAHQSYISNNNARFLVRRRRCFGEVHRFLIIVARSRHDLLPVMHANNIIPLTSRDMMGFEPMDTASRRFFIYRYSWTPDILNIQPLCHISHG